jgi:hypothetical protein
MSTSNNAGRRTLNTLVGLTCVYVSLLGWHALTARVLSFAAMGILLMAVLTAFALGDVLLKCLLQDQCAYATLSFRLLGGSLVGMASLYVVALVVPFGLPVDGALLAGAALLAWWACRRGSLGDAFSKGQPSEVCFLIAVLAMVSLWCRDLLRPIDSTHAVTVIRVWSDVYYHLSQIGVFADSTGASTVYDVQMAGVVAHPYHFASYLFPALMVKATGIGAWAAYASFLVPVAVLLTALAAFAMASPLFGQWPAAAAGLGLLLLPDAFQQGFRNPFMGYHWLQQVGPAGSYGVASAAMSFLLMIEACRSKRFSLVFASYAFVLTTLVFKAQIFVAIAYVSLIYPALFFGGLALWHRVGAVTLLTLVFVAVVRASQSLPSVPVLRLDGSSLTVFTQQIFDLQLRGPVKVIFSGLIMATGQNTILLGLAFGFVLLFITFGIFPIWYGMQINRLRRQFEPTVWLFPVLITCAFLTMALGLKLDDRHIGMPEELLHRPFVWAYFVLVVWAVAGGYRLQFGDARPSGRAARTWVVAAVLLTLIVPGYLGRGIQTLKSWDRGYQTLPSCRVRAAAFVQGHSLTGEIVQDAQNDPDFILSGLSERRPYAIDSGGVRVPLGMRERLGNLARLRSLPVQAQAADLMKQLGIQWFVVGPSADVVWARESSTKAAFECEGYRVFRQDFRS